jgi:hypothetical protein
MIARQEAPEGFDSLEGAVGTLLVRQDLRERLLKLGLDAPEGWNRLLSSVSTAAGRGGIARIELPSGERLVLKKLLRGGLAGELRRELFVGRSRLLGNLHLPAEARLRGVPTAAPAALLLVPASGGHFRGWLAMEEISGARDLLALYASGGSPSESEMRAAMRAVHRMHDAGLVHRDLNLGNLLVRGEGEACEGFVVDLDGAELRDRPLTPKWRLRALRRIERSYVKQAFLAGRSAERSERDRFYRLYEAKFSHGGFLGALQIFMHRLWWRLF